MPRISAFYGIVIWMYHDEIHHRGPHFLALVPTRPLGHQADIAPETLYAHAQRRAGVTTA